MKLKVELIWWNGIVEDGDPVPAEPDYELVDADSGNILSDRTFVSYEELEAYIAVHYPGCERWVPPPAPVEEAASVARVLDMLEEGIELDPGVIRRLAIRQLYQCSYPDETLTRIKARLSAT